LTLILNEVMVDGALMEVREWDWEWSGGLLCTVIEDSPGFNAEKAHRGLAYIQTAVRLGRSVAQTVGVGNRKRIPGAWSGTAAPME
jgi:hypothetical protein